MRKGFRGIRVLAALLLCSYGGFLRAQVNVTTYHNDIARTGQNTQETILTTGNVNSSQFGKLFSVPVDGAVYAQPLYLSGVSIAGGTHNVVYVATEHDSLYAIDADSGAVYYQLSLIPVGGSTVSSSGDLGCSDIVPEVGITGTPVIDPNTKTLYVVAKAKVNGAIVQYLHAIDAGTLLEKFGGPTLIQGSVAANTADGNGTTVSFNPLQQNQRAALLLESGHVIIAWSSHCDTAPWHGWVMSYGAATLAQEAVYNDTTARVAGNPDQYGSGGIWMAGGGPAADSSGNIYLATGNGTWNGTTDLGDSIIKFGPPAGGTLPVLDYFTPHDQANLESQDTDVGAGGVVLLPPSGSNVTMLAQQSKAGTIYLLNTANLGKYCGNLVPACNGSDPQILEEIQDASAGIWGSPAYWNGNLYWTGSNDPIQAYSFNPNSGVPISTNPTSQSTQIFAFSAPTPSISANGTGNGILWALDGAADDSTCDGGGQNCLGLYAYDATNLGHLLYTSSQAANNRDSPGTAVKFATPIVANGKVFVGTQSSLAVYGLLTAGQTAAAPTLSPSAGSYGSAIYVTLSDATPGAVIHYTTNGTPATSSSAVYTGPFQIGASTTVSAIAVASGYANSAVAGGAYAISAGGAVLGVNLAPADNMYAIANNGAPNSGLNGGGYAYSANLLGTSISWNGATYTIGGAGAPNAADGVTIPLPTGNYTALSFLGSGIYGNQPNQVFIVTYTDGSTSTFTQSLSDWGLPQHYAGESIVSTTAYRVTPTGATQAGPWYIYGYSFALNGSKTVKSLTLPNTTLVVVMAIDLTTAALSNTTANPAANPGTGSYSSAQSVSLTDGTPGATIYYTLNGTTPTTASAVYGTPLPISSTTSIKAIAVAPGYLNSGVTSAAYTINIQTPAASPVLGPAPGSFASAQSVTLTDSTPGAVIHYTLDGSTPTTASATYSAALTVAATTTVKAIAVASGYLNSAVSGGTYTIQAATPTAAAPGFNPAPGAFTAAQTVTLSDTTPGAVIHYTLDGSTPTTASPQYANVPLQIGATTTVNAIAVAAGYSNSAVSGGTYTLTAPGGGPVNVSLAAYNNVTAIVANGANVPGGGMDTFGNAFSSALLGNSITWGGSTFTFGAVGAADAVDNAVVAVPAGSYTAVNVLATGVDGNQPNQTFLLTYSDGSTTTYTQSVSDWHTPQNYAGETQVLSMPYRLVQNGGQDVGGPFVLYGYSFAANSAKTLQSITLPNNRYVIALAVDAIGAAAANPTAAAPGFNPAPGAFTAAQTVTLSDTTPGAVIHYTLDGSTPTTASPQYANVPLQIGATTTVNAIAVAAGYSNSAVSGGTYTLTAPGGGPVNVSLAAYNNVTAIVANGANVPGGGMDTFGNAFSSALLGNSITWGGSTFTFGAVGAADAVDNAVVAVPAGSYTAVNVLATGVDGNQPNQTFLLTYSDGSTTTYTQSVSDWHTPQNYAGETQVLSMPYRLVQNGGQDVGGPFVLYGYSFAANSAKTLQSITLPNNRYVIALAVDAIGAAAANPTAAAPGFNPAPGAFTAAQTVTLSDTTPGAVIHYTLDGSTPTTASPQYANVPLQIGATTTVNAIAVAAGYSNSAVSGGTYTIQAATPAAAAPGFNPAPGSFTAAQTVTLSDTTPGAVIYYTLDGSMPTAASTRYSAPLQIATTTPINAIAMAAGYLNSVVASGVFTVTPQSTVPLSVSLSAADNVFGIVANGTTVTNGGLDGDGNSFSSTLVGTSITWAGSTFTLGAPGVVDGVSGATIALPPGHDTVLNLLATGANGNQQNQAFVVAYTDGTTTTFTQSVSDWHTPQNYAGETQVLSMPYRVFQNGTLDNVGPFVIYGYSFALNAAKTVQSITLPNNRNVVVLAVDVADTAAAIPALNPAPGSYNTTQTVTLSDTTPGAVIYFTLDGTTPTTTSTPYANLPLQIGATTTVNAIAVAPGYLNSAVGGGLYTINLQSATPAATPQLLPAPGGYNTTQTVTLSDTTPGAVIYYTLDGSTPTTTSTPYANVPLQIGATTTVNAIAVAPGYLNSTVGGGLYTINLQSATPAATPQLLPAPGGYNTTQTVTLSDTTPGAMIYFTLDGSMPTAASTPYANLPLQIGATTTVNAIAVAPGYLNSTVGGGLYTINLQSATPAATPQLLPAPGGYNTTQTVTLSDTTPGAVIYYTLDGSTPTTTSTPYANVPLQIGATTTVNAIAVAPGYLNSAVGGGVYTITGGLSVSLSTADTVVGIVADGTPVSGGGLDSGGSAYSATALGTSVTWLGSTFSLGAPGVPDAASSAVVALPAGNFSTVNLLGTGVFGNQPGQIFVVTYTDGTTTTFTQDVSDWFTPQNYAGESIVSSMAYRIGPSGAPDPNGPFNLYGYSFAVNPAKVVKSITLPNNRLVVVLAIDLK